MTDDKEIADAIDRLNQSLSERLDKYGHEAVLQLAAIRETIGALASVVSESSDRLAGGEGEYSLLEVTHALDRVADAIEKAGQP